MKVSGFTLVRSGVKYSYPFREAIYSILPLCDELIINVGISDDDTLNIVKSISSDKIIIIERTWDMTLREGGKLLSVETNNALQHCTGDWCFYIQADEVLHEKDYPTVTGAMQKYFSKNKIEGLRFKYQHFYGTYDYYQDNFRKWYRHEVRIIKNHRNIVSWDDAMSFKHKDGTEIKSIGIEAKIFHYGWVKPPERMSLKRTEFHKLYYNDEQISTVASSPVGSYTDLGNLKRFTEAHPTIMQERINQSQWDFDSKIDEQYADWIRKILIFLFPITKRIKKVLVKWKII
jgi:glycosyltransferase involved in cell wall biosynthesis